MTQLIFKLVYVQLIAAMEAARLEEAERRRAEQERNREEQRRRKQEDRERRRQQREAERNRGPTPRSQERARAHTPKAAKPKKERTVGDKPVFVSKNVVGRDPSLAIGRDPGLVGAKANLALGRDRSLAKGLSILIAMGGQSFWFSHFIVVALHWYVL